jgi:hypothetical protein
MISVISGVEMMWGATKNARRVIQMIRLLVLGLAFVFLLTFILPT